MAKPIVLDQEWLERIAAQVEGLEYGSVLITVHDGRVVQIDRTERKRYDAAASKQQSQLQNSGDKRKLLTMANNFIPYPCFLSIEVNRPVSRLFALFW